MTEETTTAGTEGTEVATTTGNEVSTLSSRLTKHMANNGNAKPKSVLELVDTALGEGEDSFKSDEFYEKAKGLLEKVGLLDEYLVSKGVETEGNISEWRPTIVGLYSGKGNQAQTLGHLKLGTLFNHGTKAGINLDDKFFPIFIHGEEILKDDSGMNIEDRIKVGYQSGQQAQTPGYDYQNIVYLMNRSLTEVFHISVKNSGHKFVTNLLRNFMLPNYKKGIMFDPAKLKTWLSLDVTEHKSKSGFTNSYARLTVTDEAVTSDEARIINIMQRKAMADFRKALARANAEQAEASETQELLESNTTTDAAGDNFTQL